MSETIAGSVQLTHALDGPDDVEISKHYEEGGARLGRLYAPGKLCPIGTASCDNKAHVLPVEAR